MQHRHSAAAAAAVVGPTPQPEVLRTSAWGNAPPNTGHMMSDAGRCSEGQGLGQRAPADRSIPEGDRISKQSHQTPSVAHATTDARADGANQSRSVPLRRAETEPLVQRTDVKDVPPAVKSVEQKMRDMMDHPLLVRKKTFKDLLVEHHPDKNSSENATEVFQAVNNARSWFLHDS